MQVGQFGEFRYVERAADIVFRAVKLLQIGEVLNAREISDTLIVHIEKTGAGLNIATGDVAFAVSTQEIVAEIGVRKIGFIDNGHIVAADIDTPGGLVICTYAA